MSLTRRRFVTGTVLSGTALLRRTLLAQAAASSAPRAGLAGDAERPQFHLLPAHNWMNDPNGPIYFGGRYHMFFQYNPQSAVWGNMSWNHAVSTDLLHWTHLPLALTETPGGADAAGCFSGSCLAVEQDGHQRVYAIYTGVVKDTLTPTIKAEGLRESQCLAWSDDALLRTWSKQAAPVIAGPPAGLNVTGFRDPALWTRQSAAKNDGWHYLTVGSGIAGTGGCVLLYRSRDLHTWEYLHVLAQGTGTGQASANPVGNGEMWECPDFFALDGGHVLIYSTEGKVYWQSGVLDEATLTFHATRSGLLDLDAFYAPKTQLDAAGRRILWGWIPERRPEAAMLRAGWSGMMSLPRVMSLDADGALRLRFLPAISTLRGRPVALTGSTSGVLPRASGELLCQGRAGQDFTLRILNGAETILEISYVAATHRMMADGHEVQLESADAPALHAFVDCSVVEVMMAERIGYTKRFYAGTAHAPDLSVSASGAALQLLTIHPISPDRLTTGA